MKTKFIILMCTLTLLLTGLSADTPTIDFLSLMTAPTTKACWTSSVDFAAEEGTK